MYMKYQILVIGAGRIGQAIGGVLADHGNTVHYWDKVDGVVPDQKDLQELVPRSDIIFLGIPSWTMREALTAVVPFMKPSTFVFTPAKGIETESLKTVYEVLDEFLTPRFPFALMYGPLMAEEIKQGIGGVGLIAAREIKTYHILHQLFLETNIRLEYTSDMAGAALLGPLKNVYALGLGIADALELGGNVKGWLLTQAIREMALIVQSQGGRAETVYGSGGVGDLVLTGYSPHSRNRAVGEKLIKEGKYEGKSEGIVSVLAIGRLVQEKFENLPFAGGLYDIVWREASPREVYMKIFNKKYRDIK